MDNETRSDSQEQLDLGRRVTRHPITRSRTVGDDTFIVNLHNDSLHYMPGVGTMIWQLCDGQLTLAEIAAAVAQKYDASLDVVRADVLDFADTLNQKGLVTIEGWQTPLRPKPVRNPDLASQSMRLFTIAQQKCIPLTAFLMLTHACNLSCYYCYDAGQRSSTLTYPQWCDVLDQLAEAGTLFVKLTGGEPTTYPDFLPIAEYAARSGFAVSLVTNGTRITPQIADRLARLHLEDVIMTFHGSRAEVHDALAGRDGAFELTCRSVKLLLERGVDVSLNMVVTRRNFDEVDNFVRMLNAWGLPSHNCLTISVVARTSGATDTLVNRLSPEQIQSLMRRGLFRPYPVICNAATAKCVITPDGHVTPCHLFMPEVGDLKQSTFAEIWEHAPELRRMREEQWFAAPDECLACPAFDKYCFRCPAQAYYVKGHFGEKSDWDCRIVDLYQQTLQEAAVPA